MPVVRKTESSVIQPIINGVVLPRLNISQVAKEQPPSAGGPSCASGPCPACHYCEPLSLRCVPDRDSFLCRVSGGNTTLSRPCGSAGKVHWFMRSRKERMGAG